MVNFTKIFGLAGTALVFAGMAFGQATPTASCTLGTPPNTGLLRAEGTTEQLAQLNFVCTSAATNVGTTAAGNIGVQLFLSPTLPITSKITTSSTNQTEAVITSTSNGVANANARGTLVGTSSLTFTVAVPAIAPGQQYNFTVSNVRVNAASVVVGGAPSPVSESLFVSGPPITATALASTPVGYVTTGISSKVQKQFVTAAAGFPTGTANTGGTNNFVICNAVSPKVDGLNAASVVAGFTAGNGVGGKSLAFVAVVSEGFQSAFKGDATNTGGTEQPQVGGLSNAVSTNDRIKLVFSNVPANLTLYVPTGLITSTAGIAQIRLTSSEAGGFTTVSNASGSGAANGLPIAAVSVSSNTGTAVFDVQMEDIANTDTFNIPVFVSASSNAVAGSSTALTFSASFAPVGSSNIPNFTTGASTTTLTGSTFNLCTTSLLFPFVTNQLGFDTGVAISNTSTDPFGGSGATAQAGTCTLNFYGAGAPSPSNVVTPNVPSGTVYTQVLSGVAAGFQGYMIAQCAFQFAHGFAFITNGVGVNGGLSQGYLAGVIPDTNQKGRGADPLSVAGPGSGETLGQ